MAMSQKTYCRRSWASAGMSAWPRPYIGNAASEMTARMVQGVPQADGSIKPEPRMPLKSVSDALLYMANLAPDSNVLSMTVMATTMPFVGRG